MKKVFKLFSLLLISITFFSVKNVYAASGSYSISSNSSVTNGNNISVTFYINSKQLFYWQSYITYDTSRLQLVSGSTTFQGEDTSSNQNTNSVKKTLTFKAKKTGTAWVSIAPGDSGMNLNWNNQTISYKKVTKNITIKEKVVKTYSKNNYLKSLSVDGGKLSPSFNKDNLEYSIELPAGTEKIKINATKEDSEATISGIGEKTVTEGKNSFNIKVTAENGNERTYKLVVNVKELDPINVKVNNDDFIVIRKAKQLPKTSAACKNITVKINNNDVPALDCETIKVTLIGLKDKNGNIALYILNKENTTYSIYNELSFNKLTIVPIMEKFDIPKGYKKTTEKINDKEIVVYKKDNKSSYSIFYGLNLETNKKNIYLYDNEENTIQRYDNSNLTTNKLFNKITSNNIYEYLTYGLAIILVITYLVILIVLLKKLKKPKKVTIHKK